MKILKLVIIFMLNLLNNLETFVATFAHRTYFRRNSSMEQDEQDGEVSQQQQIALRPGTPVERIIEEIEAEGFDAMDLINGSDDEESVNEENEEDEDRDNTRSNTVEIAAWILKQLHDCFEQCKTQPTYTFTPHRLLKCNYKAVCEFGEYPTARSGHRIIASESTLYSLGGYNPSRVPNVLRRDGCMLFQELWAYNFATNRWKLLLHADNSDMPRELASNALVLYNNVLISHGGTGYPFGETCSNDCYVYTIGDNAQVMRLGVTGDLPTAQYGPGIVIHNDYLYTIGGTTGFDYTCDVYRLNLHTKVWENVYICRPDMRDDPEGRYRHEVVYDGSYIYVLGGGTSHTVYDLQRIPAFNLTTNRWEYFDTIPDRMLRAYESGFPKPRKCLSCVQHTLPNGDIEAFITGGLQGDFSTYFNDIWKLNLRTKEWCKIVTAYLPRPLYFHSAAHAGNGCMYIFGGIEYSEKEVRRNCLFKMWMTIPKLSEICWDAITYYNNNLHYYNREKLLQIGIPERFVNRVPLQKRPRKHISDESSQSLIVTVKRMRSQTE
uniref:Kelch domain-containing protein 10 homolog n=1 Tax=Glossina morsitans morsitans TaxID=37546 RepID=A0A1B0FDL9_GLOMM